MPRAKRSLEEKREQAKKALKKPATLGPDINISRFSVPEEKDIELDNLSPQDKKTALETGVDISEKRRSGTFFQIDSSVVCARSQDKGLEVLSTTKAREKYPWLEEYMWEAVPADSDKYTAETALRPTHGYFIRAKKGRHSTFPLQACLFIGQEGVA